MPKSDRGRLPVDDRGTDDVDEADWCQGGLPDPYFDRLATSPAAQEALDSVMADIRKRQPSG